MLSRLSLDSATAPPVPTKFGYTRRVWRLNVVALTSLIPLVAGCGTRSSPPSAAPTAASCALLPAPAGSPESVTIAVPGELSPDAPLAHTAAERFVFAQLYEPLVHVDCEGHLYPGLARSWTADGSRHQWTFRLRTDARFWNGEPVRALDVVAAWRSTARATPDVSGDPAHWIADSASVVDDSTIAVNLGSADAQPLVLAEEALSIYRPGPGWPLGTGSFRVEHMPPGTNPSTLELLPTRSGAPRVTVRTGGELEIRDLLDAGTDLAITSDPSTLGYAASRTDLQSLALPWDRTYVLLSPQHQAAADSNRVTFAAALARDAVRAEARPAEGPFWWSGLTACATQRPSTSFSSPTPRPRIVYRAGDRVAAAVANRLAALGEIGTAAGSQRTLASVLPEIRAAGRNVVAVGLEPAQLESALRSGSELAYVLDLPRQSLIPCRDFAVLTAAAPWLGPDAASRVLVPLIDTRAHVIARRSRISIVIDGDGTLHLVSPPVAPTG